MKNKKKFKLNDKREYLKFCLKTRIFDYIMILFFSFVFGMIVFLLIITNLLKIADLRNVNIIYYILWYILVVFIVFCFRESFRILFFNDVYVIDGHIFKKHTFISESRDDGKTLYESKARAISNDGTISTRWKSFPDKYFSVKEIPVKIIIYKNKGIDFYNEDLKLLKK